MITQGEMIDNIERNIGQATEYVEQAKIETKQAVTYQKKARRVRIFFLQLFHKSLSKNCSTNLITYLSLSSITKI